MVKCRSPYFEQRKSVWLAQVRRKGAPSIIRTFDLKADAEAWAARLNASTRVAT